MRTGHAQWRGLLGGLGPSLSRRLGWVGDAEREMSDFDSNPFAEPDLNNPFKDPSVTQVTRNVPPGLDEYNPFSDSRTVRLFLIGLLLNIKMEIKWDLYLSYVFF